MERADSTYRLSDDGINDCIALAKLCGLEVRHGPSGTYELYISLAMAVVYYPDSRQCWLEAIEYMLRD